MYECAALFEVHISDVRVQYRYYSRFVHKHSFVSVELSCTSTLLRINNILPLLNADVRCQENEMLRTALKDGEQNSVALDRLESMEST